MQEEPRRDEKRLPRACRRQKVTLDVHVQAGNLMLRADVHLGEETALIEFVSHAHDPVGTVSGSAWTETGTGA